MKPTLVLLPGMDGTGELFRPLIAALGDSVDVIPVRYPAAELLDYAALTAWVRSRLPKHKPFLLLGESFSGPIAVSLAADSPPQLKGLILCASFVRNPRPMLAGVRQLVAQMPMPPIPAQVVAPLLLGGFSTPELRMALNSAIAQLPPATLRERLSAVLSVDATEQLTQVKVPCLYLRAIHDRLVPKAAAELILRIKPDTVRMDIPGPHCLLQAMPHLAAAEIWRFIAFALAPANRQLG